MRFKIISILALAVFGLISCTRTQTDVRGAEPSPAPSQSPTGGTNIIANTGRVLFLKNCAHCHGADARGDEGPDLHALDDSDQWIANRIRDGKKGKMTAFGGKLQPADIDALVAYLHTLK
jgi:mono/diheme cytochrome c family protein